MDSMDGGTKVRNWKTDKKWSDKYLPEIKRILGEHLISEPPITEDQERNTDLMVLGLGAIRIGCRVREARYLNQYGGEYTIRSERPNGTKTELSKIIEGWGDYFFYGFGGDQYLVKWVLCDLRVFRLWFTRQCLLKGNIPGIPQKNKDGSSNFYCYKLAEMPSDFVIAKSFEKKSLPKEEDFVNNPPF